MVPVTWFVSFAGRFARSVETSALYDLFQSFLAIPSQTGVARRSGAGASTPLWHFTHFASRIGWIVFGKLKPRPETS